MKTGGQFTLHRYTIKVPAVGVPMRLIFFGDVHRDSPLHAKEKWQEFLRYSRTLKNAWFLGMGDYIDSMSTSERESMIRASMHESTTSDLENMALGKVSGLAKELDFMRGRLVGLLNGNHYFSFPSGINSDQKLCEKLGCKYLGVSSFIRITFLYGGTKQTFDIWAHHGTGGARLPGGSINRVDQMREAAEADAYCVDDETEILTLNGWRKRPGVSIGDVVAGFDLKSSEIRWVPVLDKVDFEYSGPAVALKNLNHSSLMHPKHRVVYRYETGWLVGEAGALPKMGGQIQIPMAGSQSEELPQVSDNELALAGWLISEGTFDVSGVRITQKYEGKIAIIRSLLEALKYKWSFWTKADGCSQFYISKKHRAEIDALLPDKKAVPKWLYKVSNRQFAIFLNTLVLGDGARCGPRTVTVYASSEQFIDDLQAVCAVHGYRTAKRFKSGGFKDGGWSLIITSRGVTNLPLSREGIASTQHYAGRMWCVSTETTTFLARRRGNVFVTGNCMGHDHKRSCIPANPKLHLMGGTRNSGEDDGLRLKEKQQWLMRTGSFLKAYEDGAVSYNADAARGPCSLGHVELEFVFNRTMKDRVTTDRLDVRGIA